MKIKYYEVNGIDFAVRASGLPHAKSWEETSASPARCNKLAAAPVGSGHDVFLGGITVHVVIQAKLKWFDQFNRYHFVWPVGSTSAMHQFPSATEEEIDDLAGKLLYDRALVFNYRQLKTIFHQRKNHRLNSWRIFCDWIRGLEMSSWITGEEP